MRERPLRKLAADTPGLDLDRHLDAAINGVKMRRSVIAVVHRDDNAEEAAQLGHPPL